MSVDALRAAGFFGAVLFAAVAHRLLRPNRRVVAAAGVASVVFALADLVIEYKANVHGIWVCVGSFTVLTVPVVMLGQFFFQGLGLCFIMYAVMKKRGGARLFFEMALFSTVLATVLFLLEFVWRDAGVTKYLRGDTWVYVLAAWNALLAILLVTFYVTSRVAAGGGKGRV